jgi:hypothetical protein
VNAPDLPTLFAVPLTRLGIAYAVTGGVAAIIYGEPRFTRDIDIVLRLYPHDAERLIATFPPEAFYVPPLETIQSEVARPEHGHFTLLHLETGLRADLYLATDDPLDTWGQRRFLSKEWRQARPAVT